MKLLRYRKLSKEELKKELKKFNMELIKSKGFTGLAKYRDKEKKLKWGGSDLTKRIKKEIARVKTILREKEIKNEKEKNICR